MKNQTVKELKVIAKSREIKGYYKMRKAELIKALESSVGLGKHTNILDEPIPMINVPILKPTKISNVVAKPIKKEIDKFTDWILSYVPKPVKKTTNKREQTN